MTEESKNENSTPKASLVGRLVSYLKFFLCKWRDSKTWWVAEYSISKGRETGRFACMGKSKNEALADAARYIQESAWTNGDCEYSIRRPNMIEVFFGV